MKEQDWQELQEDAPAAVGACLQYFRDRYIGNWQAKLLKSDAIIDYLNGKGFEITVTTWGVPNRSDWYFDIHHRNKLWKHQRNFETREDAARQAIGFVFVELEKDFTGFK